MEGLWSDIDLANMVSESLFWKEEGERGVISGKCRPVFHCFLWASDYCTLLIDHASDRNDSGEIHLSLVPSSSVYITSQGFLSVNLQKSGCFRKCMQSRRKEALFYRFAGFESSVAWL